MLRILSGGQDGLLQRKRVLGMSGSSTHGTPIDLAMQVKDALDPSLSQAIARRSNRALGDVFPHVKLLFH